VSNPDQVGIGPWFRLYRKEFASQFYPSPGSRLTPSSREFPCVYLAATPESTVAEVWGDRLAAHREHSGRIFAIPATLAAKWAFLKLERLPQDLRLLDLTQSASLLAAGLDAATLYVPDLRIPQDWAERVARHPTQFDGIAYRSRHTGEKGLVLWNQLGGTCDLESRLRFEPAGEFLESEQAYCLAGHLGLRLAFVR
jgi:hypothetical protein